MDMNNKSYSDRTKYRKIAAQVAKFVQEAQDADSDYSLVSASGLRIEQPSDQLVEHLSDAVVSYDTELQTDAANMYPLESCMHQLDDMWVDTVDTTQTRDVCEGQTAGFLDAAITSVDIESNDGQFIEPAEWRPRAVDAESDDSDIEDSSLQDHLSNWASHYNVSQVAVTDLLSILHPYHPDLPQAAKTLLCTKRKVEVKMVSGGEYYYFGLSYWLKSVLESGMYECAVEQLTIHVNIDGIPLFRSSLACLWPILCSVEELEGTVFPVAIYCSNQKPKFVDDYMRDFIDEMLYLKQFGFSHNGKLYSVKLRCLICDAPARAFVKCIKPHTGYNCCERCVQHGEWMRSRILLLDLEAPLRTNASFISKFDPGHHVAVSPLTELQFGMVTDFPLDYMHLVCLGVIRRIIHQWTSGQHCYKLSQGLLSAISERLVSIQPFISREFSRKPRSLSEHKLWKATELRLFLIYTGPVIVKGLLAPEVYSNFLDLSVAIRILLTPDLVQCYVEYCSQLLKYFVESFCNLYGKDQIVYNVHSLIHLCDDARQFGALDSVSAFRFESFLGRLVKLVRRPQQPCAQVVRRLLERPSLATLDVKHSRGHHSTWKKPHMEGPVTLTLKHCRQFKQYNAQQYFMSTSEGDNCFSVMGRIGLVKNILREREDESENGWVLFEEFTVVESFFSDPLDSQDVFVYFVSKLAGIRNVYSLNDVASKYVLLPYKHGFVALRQMHQS